MVKNRRSACLILLFMLCLSFGACNAPWSNNPSNEDIELSGSIEAHEVDLAFQVGGRIQTIEKDEGELVTVNTLIARLDPKDFELNLQQTQSQADAAQAAYAALKAGTRSQELRVSEADLARAKAELKFAESDVHRVSRLVPKQLASMEQLEEAQLRYEVALTSVDQAEQRLALAREGPRKEDLAKAQAEYAARQDAVQSAQQQLSYTRLNAPVDGVITLRLAEVGEIVAPGQTVLRMADMSRLWVRAYLNETQLARVRLNQAAEVRFDGVEDVLAGRLSFISPSAEFTPKVVETRELRVDLVYRVKIDVQDPKGLLKIGMPVDIRLQALPES